MIEDYKRFLYANTFCAYRDKYNGTVVCRHKYGYGICDLDLCPIVNEKFANIIFQSDGVYLITKRPSQKYVAGEWQFHKLDITSINDYERIKEFVENQIQDMPDKIRDYTLRKLDHIFQRWKFLHEKNKLVGILAPKSETEHIEEELETPKTESIEEELSKELEKIE